ncbi:hypothetical protein QVD99_002761 [Batrachochytrium dendrobatidis]|nr:hypothetical protein QVD99_002761 [Batrachochytrium dendrobatidis]
MATSLIAANRSVSHILYNQTSFHLTVFRCTSFHAVKATWNAKSISIKATQAAQATLQHHQSQDKLIPRKPRVKLNEFTPSAYMRPAHIPLNIQRICGVLIRALVDANYITALEQYRKLVEFDQVNALSLDEMLNLFRLVVSYQQKKPNPKIVSELDLLMQAILERADADVVRYGGISVLPPAIFFSLLNCHVKLQQTDSAELIWEYMLSQGIGISIASVNLMLQCYASLGRVDMVQALMKKCAEEGIAKLDIQSFVTLIDAYSKSGQTVSSLEVLDRALQSDIPLNIRIFNHIISGLAKNGKFAEMIKVLVFMQEKEFLPSTVTYNNIIHGCVVSGQFQKAHQIFQEMTNDAGSSAERNDQCGPDTATFNIIIDLFAKQGDHENAFAMLDEMIKRGVQPNVVSYNTVLGAYGRAGMLSQAQDIFDTIDKMGISRTVTTYNLLISAYGFQEHMQTVLNLFEQMQDTNLSPDRNTFAVMISLHGMHDCYDKCLDFFTMMRERGILPDSRILANMMRIAIRTGAQTAEVRGFFDMAVEKGMINIDLCHLLLLSNLIEGRLALHEALDRLYVSVMKPHSIQPKLKTLDIVLDSILKPTELVQKYTLRSSFRQKGSIQNTIAAAKLNDAFQEEPIVISKYHTTDSESAKKDEHALISLVDTLSASGHTEIMDERYQSAISDAINIIRP